MSTAELESMPDGNVVRWISSRTVWTKVKGNWDGVVSGGLHTRDSSFVASVPYEVIHRDPSGNQEPQFIQPPTLTGLAKLINHYASELQTIYDGQLAGEYTFIGVLSEFARRMADEQ